MARYEDRARHDPLEAIYKRLSTLEDQNQRLLKKLQLGTLDRGDITTFLGPVEGQQMVDLDDEHAWYANGAWHKAGSTPASGHGAELTATTDWTNPSNGNNAISTLTTATVDTDGFYTGTGGNLVIPSGLDGIYAVGLGCSLTVGSLGTNPTLSIWYGGTHPGGQQPITFYNPATAALSEWGVATVVYLLAGWSVIAVGGKSGGTQVIDGTSPFTPPHFSLALIAAI